MHLDTDTSAYIVREGWGVDCTSESIHFYCCDPACDNCHDPVASLTGASSTNSRRELTSATACLDTADSTTSYSCVIEPTGSVLHRIMKEISNLESNPGSGAADSSTGSSAVAVTASAVGVLGIGAAVVMLKRGSANREKDELQVALASDDYVEL